MADAICRWRNPYIDTVRELIEILPKRELTKERAREIVNANSPNYFQADFYRTPYQLACQVGLYHETNGFYFPKFNFTPSEQELRLYLENWIIHYTVPNPYTSRLPNNIEPFSIHAEICRKLREENNSINWNETLIEVFGIDIGNKDILKNSFDYSPVIEIDGNTIRLKNGIAYNDLAEFINVDISSDRENKEYFFDLFELPSQDVTSLEINSNEIVMEVTREERELITQLENSNDYSQTEKNQIVKARIGQGIFRRSLIEDCPFCPITLIDDINLLIASHIKPWRSSNNIERLNSKNGLLLTPTYDKLFDNGYISFREDKTLIISPQISANNITRLALTSNMEIPNLPIEGREIYFEFHRNEILKN
jgi:hypothetical protein